MTTDKGTREEKPFNLVKYCVGQHAMLHRMLHNDFVGKDVVLKSSLYGKNRKGRIADLIFTYDVTFGVDVYRLDGAGFCETRQWVGTRGIVE